MSDITSAHGWTNSGGSFIASCNSVATRVGVSPQATFPIGDLEAARLKAMRAMLDRLPIADVPPMQPGEMQRVWWTVDGLRAETIPTDEVFATPSDPATKRDRLFSGDYQSAVAAYEEVAAAGEIVAKERNAGSTAERARILALLQELKPMEQPYTRRDWTLEQKGEKAMWERVVKAMGGEPPKKDSHEG